MSLVSVVQVTVTFVASVTVAFLASKVIVCSSLSIITDNKSGFDEVAEILHLNSLAYLPVFLEVA